MGPGFHIAARFSEALGQLVPKKGLPPRFVDALHHAGAVAMGIRVYHDRHYSNGDDLGHSVIQRLPERWHENEGARHIERMNPLPTGLRQLKRLAFRWSDASPKSDPECRIFWEAFREMGISDGLAVHFPGEGGAIRRISIGFGARDVDDAAIEALTLASAAILSQIELPEHAKGLAAAAIQRLPLSPRETACMALVSEGLSDKEIAHTLAISVTTVHTLVERAKRKLESKTRAQAAVRYATRNYP